MCRFVGCALLTLIICLEIVRRSALGGELLFDATAGNLVLLGSNRPAPMLAGMCPLPPANVCRACEASSASGRRCEPHYNWNWSAEPTENDHETYFPGLKAVRGLDVLHVPNVTTVAHWRHSNWAAIVRSGQGGVRATTRARRNRMCQLWSQANAYHSWPILLGCPGWGERQHEQEGRCGTETAVFRARCAFVDFAQPTSGWHVKGTIYDSQHWYRLDQSRTPPATCHGRSTLRLDAFGTSVGVFPWQTGEGH